MDVFPGGAGRRRTGWGDPRAGFKVGFKAGIETVDTGRRRSVLFTMVVIAERVNASLWVFPCPWVPALQSTRFNESAQPVFMVSLSMEAWFHVCC